uniref:Uncharacterized protein n=1 Tax=Avena sativa TaxID=4498 RepID=A0ACD5W2V6_AVESA
MDIKSSKNSKMLRKEQEEEEFQEADILWPADAAQDLELAKHMYYYLDDDDGGGEEFSSEHRRPSPTTAPNRQKASSSPIDIPGKTKTGRDTAGARALALQAGFSKFSGSLAGAGGSSLMIGSHVFVPPHVIVDRRAKRDTAMLMLVDVPKGRVKAMAAMLE